MRERINRLAKGMIDTEIPQINIVPVSISETVETEGVTRGEILITSENNLHIKGLIYSSNARVQLCNATFGGLRNHINYELNSQYLENGDDIKGSFYLVSNGGEKEIPYSFRVESRNSGKTLESLETARDFSELARMDRDTALRLFEYQEFSHVPFMQDVKIHTIYDGLKGRGNRQNLLEEFLVALKVKDPVCLSFYEKERIYQEVQDVIEDEIIIDKDHWGYVNIEVKADGDFIQLSKRVLEDSDFHEKRCKYSFQIHGSSLHAGRNLGSISFITAKEKTVIRLEAMGKRTVDSALEKRIGFRKGFLYYLRLRLDYECGHPQVSDLEHKMLRELDLLQNLEMEPDMISLLQAEVFLMTGREEKACLILDECRSGILKERQEQKELYCFFQYLCLQVKPNKEQEESFRHLLSGYLKDKAVHHLLYVLLLKLDSSLYETPGSVTTFLRHAYLSGCYSPFLSIMACRLWEKEPGLLRGIDSFELHALYTGAKKGMIGRDFALMIAKLAIMQKHYHKLFHRFLVLLYQQYQEKVLLEAILSMLMKGDCRQEKYFCWYENGLKSGVNLTKLYEYYLYAMPDGWNTLLPREVLLYFSYHNQLDSCHKAKLFANLLTYLQPGDPLYKQYERSIEKFAMEQLFESRIDSSLAVIYQRMIYKDVIDLPVAKVLPAILKSYRIYCPHEEMKYVIICHEELVEEDAFLLKQGVAYIPLFSEHSELLFQDAFGNRYKNIEYEKAAVMDRPELIQRCFLVYPDHPMLHLQECRRIVTEGVKTEAEVLVLEHALKGLNIRSLYSRQMLSQIISYYQDYTEAEDCIVSKSGIDFLLYLDRKQLDKAERQGICKTLINQNELKDAYEIIKEFGWEGIPPKHLMKLCSGMILKNLFYQDELLIFLSYLVFEAGKQDGVILDYLCEYFNGTSAQMYRVLNQAVLAHVETYDLEERLVAQMMFSDTTDKLDQTFGFYITRKKSSDTVVKAYFTIKSIEYFIDCKPSGNQVFTYLEKALWATSDREKVPVIYLLALTKYYASLPALTQEQKDLCENIMDILLEEGMVFPYFKVLAKFIPIPGEFMDKGMIQYHGNKNSRIDLQVRILPEEEEYHSEEMKRIYQGIFVKQMILFAGEIMEYQIYEIKGDQRILVESGSITSDSSAKSQEGSRYACLNEIGLCLNIKEQGGLKKKMKEYLIKNAVVEELFPLV